MSTFIARCISVLLFFVLILLLRGSELASSVVTLIMFAWLLLEIAR